MLSELLKGRNVLEFLVIAVQTVCRVRLEMIQLFQLCVDQIRQAEPVWSSLAVSHSRQSVRLRLPLQGRWMQSVLNEKRWHQMHHGQWCIDKLTSLISMYFLDKLQKNIVDIIIFLFFSLSWTERKEHLEFRKIARLSSGNLTPRWEIH